MVLNSAAFYGPPNDQLGNLKMLARFYEANPEYVDKTFLMVKGGLDFATPPAPWRASAKASTAASPRCGAQRRSTFSSPRASTAAGPSIQNLVVLKDEGKFKHIGMSECRAETLRRGNSVYPISVVEIEISIWSYEEEVKKVVATAAELGIAVAGYSPLGRGFLTGQVQSIDDLPPTDFRRNCSRFSDHFEHNLQSANAIRAIAEKKGISPRQLAIAWVAHLGPHVLPLPGMSSKKRTLENLAGGDIVLTAGELKAIADVQEKYPVQGFRYFSSTSEMAPLDMGLWG
ncbi:hypothetical protein FOMPIDRAFT_1021201 [Fomitopsis schrenkii]|uniref:NADP-dependent oxidoreductase domain-containing protein n=1 Tax=Fomitopsis schrenkii TaxID=2126942 RepID=S8ETD5_FOMSC|nr:hypothetical protein FOMPIDRAFT_1021201 [Fomitopsis schrenkii]